MALGCILTVHFNATVTGYFTLPHKLFTSTLPLGIYLGDFGSTLFFIVSGASLALTAPENQSPAQFYKKRARAVLPALLAGMVRCVQLEVCDKAGQLCRGKDDHAGADLPWAG